MKNNPLMVLYIIHHLWYKITLKFALFKCRPYYRHSPWKKKKISLLALYTSPNAPVPSIFFSSLEKLFVICIKNSADMTPAKRACIEIISHQPRAISNCILRSWEHWNYLRFSSVCVNASSNRINELYSINFVLSSFTACFCWIYEKKERIPFSASFRRRW